MTVKTRSTCGSRRGWPLPQTGPTLWKTQRPCPRSEWSCLEASPIRCSRRRCHPGAQGPVAESRGRNGHGCQRPSCGHGSGPTGNCMPEMPDATSHDELPRLPCSIESEAAGSSALDRRGRVCFHFRSIYPGAMGCAHAENAPCSYSSCQSKRRKLSCRFLDNAPESKQSGTTAQRRRCGEAAHVFAVAFR